MIILGVIGAVVLVIIIIIILTQTLWDHTHFCDSSHSSHLSTCGNPSPSFSLSHPCSRGETEVKHPSHPSLCSPLLPYTDGRTIPHPDCLKACFRLKHVDCWGKSQSKSVLRKGTVLLKYGLYGEIDLHVPALTFLIACSTPTTWLITHGT